MVGLGVIERRRLANLRGDGPEARGPKGRFEGRLRDLRCRQLGVRCAIDRRSILGANIVPLAHALGGIVLIPEALKQRLKGDHLWIEHHDHHLGVPRTAAAHFLVGGVRRNAPLVAHGSAIDPLELPEQTLRAPEAAESEEGDLVAFGPGALQRRAQGVVMLRHGHDGAASRQGFGGGG